MEISDDSAGESPVGNLARAELASVGQLIRDWQTGQEPRVSDAAMCNRFPQLGTTRSYKRVWSGEGLEEMNAEDWLPKYRQVWERIESDEVEISREPVYDDLGPAAAIRAAWVKAMGQTGLQRLVLVEGDTGAGKSFALLALRDRIGTGCHLIESHEGWSRLRTGLECLAAGLGIRPGGDDGKPQSAGDWLELLCRHMNKRGRRVVLIDECHHWGGEMLNALKTLINRTQWVFVIAGMKTLIDKLTATKSQEARQLLLNRMLVRIKLGAPSVKDAGLYLERRAGASASPATLGKLCDIARSYGGFAFLRRTAVQLARLPAGAPRGDDEVLEAARGALEDLGE